MKAVVVREPSGPDALLVDESAAEPTRQAGEVLVQVKAVGVNFGLDTLVARGAFGALRASRWEVGPEIAFPLTPGADIAGVIVDAGPEAAEFQAGDRVVSHFVFSCGTCRYCLRGQDNVCVASGYFGVHRNGGAAEFVSLPARNLRRIPEHLDFTDAATIPVSFAVTWNMLANLARVKPEDWVLVMAGGSGIGVAAIQIAKLHGARVIAAVGSEWRAAKAAELGADVVVNYGAGPIGDQLREATAGYGADVVIHGELTQENWDDIKGAVANQGRIVLCGALGAGTLQMDMRHYYRHHFQLLGALAAPLSAFHDVCDQFEARRLRPVIHAELPLAQIRDAHQILNDRANFGKVVLRV